MTTAVLVIDVQRDFLSPSLGEGYEARLASLLHAARTGELPVVHVHSRFEPDGSDWMPRYRRRGNIPCIRGTDGAAVASVARPVDGETVVVKHTFDAFLGTTLEEHLRSQGVDRLLVAGLVTSTCVLLSAATAMQLGFEVAVVEDAVADEPDVHAAVLDRYQFVFDRVVAADAASWATAPSN